MLSTEEKVAFSEFLLRNKSNEPCLIIYYLYFKNKRHAEKVARELSRNDLSIELKLSADNVNWLLLVSKKFFPTEEVIENINIYLKGITEANLGEYDGWELAIPE